jgi:hypothetical protein
MSTPLANRSRASTSTPSTTRSKAPRARGAQAPEVSRQSRTAATTGSTYRTWGLRRRAEPLEIYHPDRFPFIARIREHLSLSLIEVRGEGEPLQVALGQAEDSVDPDATAERVTPFFSSLESLDYFCRLNLQTYLAVGPAHLPRKWFWQEAARSSRMPARGGSIVNEAAVGSI